MPGGGLMQLVAYGAQDIYLTGDRGDRGDRGIDEYLTDSDSDREVEAFIPTPTITPELRRYARNYNMFRIMAGLGGLAYGDNNEIVRNGNRYTDRDNTDNDTKILEKMSSNDITIYDSGSTECSICMDSLKTHVFVPCGHYCTCLPCSLNIRNKHCPLCRTQFDSVVARSDITEEAKI